MKHFDQEDRHSIVDEFVARRSPNTVLHPAGGWVDLAVPLDRWPWRQADLSAHGSADEARKVAWRDDLRSGPFGETVSRD